MDAASLILSIMNIAIGSSLIVLQIWLMWRQNKINEGMLELERMRYIPSLTVESALDGTHIIIENVSEVPALNVRVGSNKREGYMELGDLKPHKDSGLIELSSEEINAISKRDLKLEIIFNDVMGRERTLNFRAQKAWFSWVNPRSFVWIRC